MELAVQVAEKVRREQPLLQGLLAVGAGFSPGVTSQPERAPLVPGQTDFIYCVKGSGWFEAGGPLHVIRKGDLLVVSPATSQAGGGVHVSSPWTLHWVRAVGEHLPDFLRELGAGAKSPVLHVGEDPQVVRLFNEILRALQRGTGLASLLLASQALAHLLALLIQRRQSAGPESSDTVQKVAEAIIYMSEHLEEPLRVSALARLAGLSAAHFSELFKLQTGCSPREYLHLLRIHQACRMLRDSTLSVKEVAARVGYQDPFHFSRQFKAFQGLSPSEYRDARVG